MATDNRESQSTREFSARVSLMVENLFKGRRGK